MLSEFNNAPRSALPVDSDATAESKVPESTMYCIINRLIGKGLLSGDLFSDCSRLPLLGLVKKLLLGSDIP